MVELGELGVEGGGKDHAETDNGDRGYIPRTPTTYLVVVQQRQTALGGHLEPVGVPRVVDVVAQGGEGELEALSLGEEGAEAQHGGQVGGLLHDAKGVPVWGGDFGGGVWE